MGYLQNTSNLNYGAPQDTAIGTSGYRPSVGGAMVMGGLASAAVPAALGSWLAKNPKYMAFDPRVEKELLKKQKALAQTIKKHVNAAREAAGPQIKGLRNISVSQDTLKNLEVDPSKPYTMHDFYKNNVTEVDDLRKVNAILQQKHKMKTAPGTFNKLKYNAVKGLMRHPLATVLGAGALGAGGILTAAEMKNKI